MLTTNEPRIEILEQPKARGFRFRYTCEGPSHGGIPGASSDKNKKTYPSVQIVNYHGYAKIVVQLVSNEDNPKLHPHSLVGKECTNGICTVQCGPKDMVSTFPNLGILHETKKNVLSVLEKRYIAAETQLSSINEGYPQEVNKNVSEASRKRISEKVQKDAKNMDLSSVRLMFIAYLPDSNGAFNIMLQPVFSSAIYDSKAPHAATLKICRMSATSGCALGGDEVYLLCDKVQKDDIQIRFADDDQAMHEEWEDYGQFSPTDVHRQYAIVFRTPPFKNPGITKPVEVYVQLRRKSNGEVSEPKQFTYLPNKTDEDVINGKRRKRMPELNGHFSNNSQGYNFGNMNQVTSPGGFSFQGSPKSNSNGLNRAPSTKQEDPQKGPMDPTMLFKHSVKQEPNSPVSSFYSSSRHTSFQDSPLSAYSSSSMNGSPRRNSTSPPPAPKTEPQFLPGTRIPAPRSLTTTNSQQQQPTLTNHQLQQQQFSQQMPTQATTATNNQQQYNEVFAPSPTSVAIQQNALPMNVDASVALPDDLSNLDFSGPAAGTFGGQLRLSYEEIASAANSIDFSASVSTSVAFQDMQTVSSSAYPDQYFNSQMSDQSQNSFQTANPNDILSQAVSQTVTGPGGSGSFPMTNLLDPLTSTHPLRIGFSTEPQRFNLSEINPHDLFDDIESDSVREKHKKSQSPVGDYDDEVDYTAGYGCDDDDDWTCEIGPAYGGSLTATTDKPSDIESDDASRISRQAYSALLKLKNLNISDAPSPDLVPSKGNHPRSKVECREPTQELKIKTKVADSKLAVEVVKELDTLRSQRNEWSKKTTCAMHDYSVTGDARMLLVLQRHLTSVPDENGDTVIHVAVIHNQLEVLTQLLDVVVTLHDCWAIVDKTNNQCQTALHIATLTDNVHAVIELLNAGADPLVVDRNGNNAIHVAVRHGNADILRRLLTSKQIKGREYDSKNHKGLGCYHLALKAKKDALTCLKLLKSHQFNVDLQEQTFGRTALHFAVESNDVLVAGCLISECDADVDVKNSGGDTALVVAVASDFYDLASLLMDCNPDAGYSYQPDDDDDDDFLSHKFEDFLQFYESSNRTNNFNIDELVDQQRDEEGGLSCLDPLLRKKLCDLLNDEETGSNWSELADRLQLSLEKTTFKESNNPTELLIVHYMDSNGTVDGFRSALMHIGRHDALQVFNRALHTNSSPLLKPKVKPIEDIKGCERYDSAIGSMSINENDI